MKNITHRIVAKKKPVDFHTRAYEAMVRIRLVEDRVAEMVSAGEIYCPCHLYTGQEAVAAGVCAALTKDDWVFSTHRSHGHYIAKGGDIDRMMAELLGKASGCSGGRGGSMHLAEPEIGLPGSSAIVAGTIPLATGAALAFKMRGKDNVSVAFFGDGAVCEGAFYESVNFAALHKLPVIFICENNLYSTHLPITECLANPQIAPKAAIFGIEGKVVDGNDVLAVYDAAAKAIENARAGRGPALIECLTYRWLGHVGPSDDVDKGLRSRQELESWKKKCPIKRHEKYLVQHNILKQADLKKIRQRVAKRVEAAVDFARRNPYPEVSSLLDHVFKEERR